MIPIIPFQSSVCAQDGQCMVGFTRARFRELLSSRIFQRVFITVVLPISAILHFGLLTLGCTSAAGSSFNAPPTVPRAIRSQVYRALRASFGILYIGASTANLTALDSRSLPLFSG